MNNINCVLEQKNNCFGCRACANICPVSAITMQEDEEGFFYPVVDETKCTNCGLCKKSCPSLNKSEVYKNNTKDPDCYALMAEDEIRAVSSSGGAFTLIANWILEQGGYVCGVAYVGQKVQHIIIDKKEDLNRLRGSKYVQSDTNTVYADIKKLLNDNKLVLFTGTPCQVSGLYSYLGKTYENLYTVDLLCHGVPPQRVFDMYLEETIGDEKFINADFRDKKQGWTVFLTVKTDKNEYYGRQKMDGYLNAFLKNMCLRPSCETCPYTTKNRASDFTIGDYWAVGRYDKNLNDEKGTSVIVVHSLKAKKLFEIIKNTTKTCVKTPIEYASWYNITLYTPLKQHPNRKAFFKLINQGKSLKETVKYCLNNPYDSLLMTTINYPNYGGVMTSYALYEVIAQMGYNPICVKKYSSENNIFLNNFIKKYVKLTDEYLNNINSIKKINEYSSTVIVGSDCNWSPFFHGQDLGYLLDWVTPSSRKISYSTSFGSDCFIDSKYEKDEDLRQKYKYYLSKFDKISVREDSGVSLLKEEFCLNAEQCSDPVFLLDKNFYFDKLIKPNCSNQNNKPFLMSYYFTPNNTERNIIASIAEKLNLELKTFDIKVTTEIETWLASIYNSDFFISNSFHGLCFALIFNKNFICIGNKKIGNTRMLSVLKKVGLENRLIRDLEDINSRPDLFEPIDWNRVNYILELEKERSLKWLKDALEAPKDLSEVNSTDVIIKDLNDKINTIQHIINLPSNNVTVTGLQNLLDYKKNYRKYVKYKILKNFVFGEKRKSYREKQEYFYNKVLSARRVRRGISGV